MNTHPQVLTPISAARPQTLQWQLHCPECGQPSVDREPLGRDHEAVTLHPDRDDYDSPIDTRGGYLHLDLRCVSGHTFALIIGNHKGAEFVGVVTTPPAPTT